MPVKISDPQTKDTADAADTAIWNDARDAVRGEAFVVRKRLLENSIAREDSE